MDVIRKNKFTLKTPQKIEKKESKKLAWKTFCFTGKINYRSRTEVEALVKQYGGIPKGSVVKNLDYLVMNTPNSGTGINKAARAQGSKIIDEQEFLDMLK